MSIHNSFFQAAVRMGWERWTSKLEAPLSKVEGSRRNADRDHWEKHLQALSTCNPTFVDLDTSRVTIGRCVDLSMPKEEFEQHLHGLHPWRKGPFELFGSHLDTEWRSDWKWDRVLPHIQPLAGKTVLDVGCGSGYHCFRMSGAGAKFVLGVDPSQLFWMQFLAIKTWLPHRAVFHLPLPLEDIPMHTQAFDTVFSMGVLYHRKSPFDHLYRLRSALRTGGEMILETLVVDGGENTVFVPPGRYAQMNNVWFLPSVPTLTQWMKRVGLRNIRCVDVTKTTIEEQRATSWMRFNSLSDYLDPTDDSKTTEGHPAPVRAVMIAQR
jgi:tRNA (mo5U34)-methyltransferase